VSIVICGDEEIAWMKVLDAMRSFLLRGNSASTPSIIRLFSQIYTAHQSSQAVQLDELLDLSNYRAVATSVYNLKLFTSDTGSVESTYANPEENDLICVFFGWQLPVVLRPAKNINYTLFDAVYVDGIMNGEFLKTSSRTIRKFVLV
jgi:hypothetical protein